MIIAVHVGYWPRTNSPQTGQPFASFSTRTQQVYLGLFLNVEDVYLCVAHFFVDIVSQITGYTRFLLFH